MNEPLYPDVEVQLTGQDGNAFVIIGTVSAALRRAEYRDAADEFFEEATSGDYDNVIRTAMKYVSVL